MHGLINRSIQCFIRDTYGPAAWGDVALAAKLGFSNFESLMTYDDELTFAVIDAACLRLDKPRDTLLEDLGTYLCSHPNLEPVRRLLRFGGGTFSEFLCSLDDLDERARLAVSDLELPNIELYREGPGIVSMYCEASYTGFGHLMVGVLRAMADDYGTLALLEHMGIEEGREVLSIRMLDAGFSSGREFSLAGGVA